MISHARRPSTNVHCDAPMRASVVTQLVTHPLPSLVVRDRHWVLSCSRMFIVTNPLRSTGRLNSDLAHELSHILLGHDLSEVREVNGVPFRTCQPNEEEEATAFGGTLLLPRPLLLSAARLRASSNDIAER